MKGHHALEVTRARSSKTIHRCNIKQGRIHGIRCILARTDSSLGRKRHFCIVSARVWPTNGQTDGPMYGPMYGPTDGRTHPLVEMPICQYPPGGFSHEDCLANLKYKLPLGACLRHFEFWLSSVTWLSWTWVGILHQMTKHFTNPSSR